VSGLGWAKPPRPSKPDPVRIAAAVVAPIIHPACPKRISAISEIARLVGNERPDTWQKPNFGQFEYWLAHQCGWISDEELEKDTQAYQRKRTLAQQSSHIFSMERYSWDEKPRFEVPPETGEYVPQVNMKLVKDRNLTDSARRVAMFVLRHAYQDNRKARYIGMTVSFIEKGLSLSRRTVQRSLTLLETRGYFHCQVAKGEQSRMCVGLIIHLMETLFPKHHRKKWPKKRTNSGASSMPQKQIRFYKTIYEAKQRVSRFNWTLRCMDAIADRLVNASRAELLRSTELELLPCIDRERTGLLLQPGMT